MNIDEDILSVITSHVYASFYYCKREGWFAAHRIHGEESNEWMARGRLVEKTYKRKGLRQVFVMGSVIDIVVDDKQDLKIVEVKASKGSIKRGIAQAEFLLYLLHRIGVENVTAEVASPTSRVIEIVVPTDEMYTRVEANIVYYYAIVLGNMPRVERSHRCTYCAYRYLCG